MKKGILLHETDDDIGVTAMDLKAGDTVQAVTLEGEPVTEIPDIDKISQNLLLKIEIPHL